MPHRSNSDSSAANAWPTRITQLALFLVIVLVISRATSMETLRDPFEVSPGQRAIPRSLTAASSVVLDWAGVLPALLVLARCAIDRTYRLRCSWSFLPLLLLALLAALSPLWSND